MDDAAFLHALIVAAADDLAVANENGSDGDAAFGQASARFFDRGLEKFFVAAHARSYRRSVAGKGTMTSWPR